MIKPSERIQTFEDLFEWPGFQMIERYIIYFIHRYVVVVVVVLRAKGPFAA